MQEIIGIRDKLRADVESLDGGYATIGKLLNKSTSHIHKTLNENNLPRLSTLEVIKVAIATAQKDQAARLLHLAE